MLALSMFPVVIPIGELNTSQWPKQNPGPWFTMHQRWMYRKLGAWLVAVKIIPEVRHTALKAHAEFQRKFGIHMCTK